MTPVLGSQGIFLRDNTFDESSHLDSYHLLNQVRDVAPDDMGVIDLWANIQKVEMPLYSMASFNGKNTVLVKDPQGRWSWQVPIVNDLPFSVEDMSPSNTTKGVDGTTFQIKLSRKEFGKGEIITYDKYSGVELYIVPDSDIIVAGDHAIYNVQLVNNDNVKYLDNKFLAGGVRWFRVGSARGEYGQTWADMNVKAGYREFFNYVSTGRAHVYYSVSDRARKLLDGGVMQNFTPGQAGNKVTEIWKSTDPEVTNNPSITSMGSMVQIMGADYIRAARKNGTLGMSYLSALDARHLTKIGMDIENYLMWGKGGRIRQDGPDDIRLTAGLWKQTDSAFLRVYNLANFSLDMFRTELFNFFNGKVQFEGPNPGRILEVWTGMAGMQMAGQVIAKEASALGWIINADQLGVIQGKDPMALKFGYAFNEVIIPFFGTLRFKLNPAFDNVMDNTIENPILADGYSLSSHSFIIWDVTDTPDNIFLMKDAYDPNLNWHYENGTTDYFGKRTGFASSGRFNGYEVRMDQRLPSLWLRDSTKLLKIVAKNPITGSHL